MISFWPPTQVRLFGGAVLQGRRQTSPHNLSMAVSSSHQTSAALVMTETECPTVGLLERYPGLVCPRCRSSHLQLNSAELICRDCRRTYRLIDDKFPAMVTGETITSDEERSVQDLAAQNAENKRYTEPWSRKYRMYMRDLIVAAASPHGLVLDNGCGVGNMLEALKHTNVVGIDLSPEAIRFAGQRTPRVLVADSQELPFADETFDVVIAKALLHHLPDYERGVAEMARVLRPGGTLVATDPNRSLLSVLPRAIAYRMFRGSHFSKDHQNVSLGLALKTLTRYFSVSETYYFGFLAYPIAFPDVLDFFRYFPAKRVLFPSLMTVDRLLSRIPVIRRLAWCVLIRATKLGPTG